MRLPKPSLPLRKKEEQPGELRFLPLEYRPAHAKPAGQAQDLPEPATLAPAVAPAADIALPEGSRDVPVPVPAEPLAPQVEPAASPPSPPKRRFALPALPARRPAAEGAAPAKPALQLRFPRRPPQEAAAPQVPPATPAAEPGPAVAAAEPEPAPPPAPEPAAVEEPAPPPAPEARPDGRPDVDFDGLHLRVDRLVDQKRRAARRDRRSLEQKVDEAVAAKARPKDDAGAGI